jgi:hypothetical protein
VERKTPTAIAGLMSCMGSRFDCLPGSGSLSSELRRVPPPDRSGRGAT